MSGFSCLSRPRSAGNTSKVKQPISSDPAQPKPRWNGFSSHPSSFPSLINGGYSDHHAKIDVPITNSSPLKASRGISKAAVLGTDGSVERKRVSGGPDYSHVKSKIRSCWESKKNNKDQREGGGRGGGGGGGRGGDIKNYMTPWNSVGVLDEVKKKTRKKVGGAIGRIVDYSHIKARVSTTRPSTASQEGTKEPELGSGNGGVGETVSI